MACSHIISVSVFASISPLLDQEGFYPQSLVVRFFLSERAVIKPLPALSFLITKWEATHLLKETVGPMKGHHKAPLLQPPW
jgi:hypothetical protein